MQQFRQSEDNTTPQGMEPLKILPHLVSLVESDLTILNPFLDVRHCKVLDQASREIGHVNDLWIDEAKCEVCFLQVGRGGLWGWGESQFLVPTEAVTAVRDGSVRINQFGGQPAIETGKHLEYQPSLIAKSKDEDTRYLSHWSTAYIYSG